MTAPATDIELIPTGRYEWERCVRRIRMPQATKLVALLLASYADSDGSRVRPGMDVLAAVTGVSERTVRRLLATLTDSYRLVEQVARGGGRGGRGRTSVYRLVLPTDLLERVELLPPSERGNVSPVIQMSGSSFDRTPDSYVSGQSGQSPVDNSESPDTQTSAQAEVSPAIQESDETDFHRTNNTVPERLTGQIESIDRTPGCPTTTHKDLPTTTDHPSTRLPAQLTTARETDDEIEVQPADPPARCEHNAVKRWRPDGEPACALCRRGVRLSTVDRVENIPANIPKEPT